MDDRVAALLLAAVFAVLIVNGVLGAVVGNLRAHPTLGFWLGLLLGPIGVLTAALLPDDR